MLVEMPFSFWNEWYFDELDKLINQRGIRPIMAHLERYVWDSEKQKQFHKILMRQVLIQFDTDSFSFFSCRRFFNSLVRANRTVILGSDCHHPVHRPCTFAAACKRITRKYGIPYLEYINDNARAVLQNQWVN